MRFISELEPEEIAELADSDFQESVKDEAKSYMGEVLDTYYDVMTTDEDGKARIAAAKEIQQLAGVAEKRSELPSGISEEVFKLALAGLGQLAGIAQSSSSVSAILRNVTPAKTDPRPIATAMLADDSPMSRAMPTDDNEAITNLIARERYEIVDKTNRA